MDKIKVKKAVLLEKLKANRAEHREIFEEALEGFRKAAVKVLEERLEMARSGKKINLWIELEQPQDQTKEYDRVIQMLEMDVGDELVEVTGKQFRNYVQDDWSWSDQFLASNSAYSGKARGKLG